jgi:hypothetical protein
MRLQRNVTAWLMAGFIACLMACTAIVPQTFNERLAAGYKTVELITDTTTVLRQANKISKADKDNVAATNSTALAALDVTASMSKTDLTGADAKLTATLAILTQLQAYLASKGKP